MPKRAAVTMSQCGLLLRLCVSVDKRMHLNVRAGHAIG